MIANCELSDKARGVARCLSYNDDVHQASAKHLLREMAHRLDSQVIRVRGLNVSNALGKFEAVTMRDIKSIDKGAVDGIDNGTGNGCANGADE